MDGEKITDIATAYVPADFEGEGKIVKKGKKNFRKVSHCKPDASRAGSPEEYLVAEGFKSKGRISDS